MRLFFSMLIVTALTLPVASQPAAPAPSAMLAGSNMPPDFYPHPTCVKPTEKLVAPGNSPDAMNSYNMRVREFNKRAAAYNTCLKTYIDKAQNDINAIQAIVHAAVLEANSH